MDFSAVEWPSMWELCDDRVLDNELKLEVALGHILYNEEVLAIARRVDCDDVLYHVISTNSFAIVHLTWSSRPENSPWPLTKIYQKFDELMTENFVQ